MDSQLAQTAFFTGSTPLFAARHDQRLSYCLYVPSIHERTDKPLPLVVIQHGTGRTAMAYRDRYATFAEKNGYIVLAPLFPAGLEEPGELHNFKFLQFRDIRFDESLLTIVDEVSNRFRVDSQRFCLHGFSGGGQFVHRFFYLHPDRLAALSIGAPGRITLIDNGLPWWLGTADLESRFGVAVDVRAMQRVPVQMVVGSLDTETWEINNVGGPNWMDGVEKTGRTRIERLETLRRNFVQHGIDVRFDLVEGVGHEGEDISHVVEDFFEDVLSRQAGVPSVDGAESAR